VSILSGGVEKLLHFFIIRGRGDFEKGDNLKGV
jgi:hypothetical protein